MGKGKCNIFKISIRLFILIFSFSYLTTFAITINKSKQIYPLLLEITLNQKKLSGIFLCYEDSAHNIWIEKKVLHDWNFPATTHQPFIHTGKEYGALSWYPEVHYHLDTKTLNLFIDLPIQYLSSTTLNLSRYQFEAIRPEQPGTFFNYDLTSIKNTGAHGLANSALMELGLFQSHGVGTTSFLASNYNAINTSARYKIIRLDSTWTLDEPENIATWRFGDAITGASNWSGAARFLGVQYATNFSTQPSYITFPLPGVKGEAIVPTNVQIFVNGILNHKQMVENGAYYINNIPVVTGAGTVNVVTQDLLGRTQIVSIPYYTSPSLLKSGLSEYSYETGILRQNYGINSNSYHRFLGTATYLYGWTNNLTLGTHGELLTNQQTLGGSADYLLSNLGIFSLAAAESHSQFGAGWLGSVGFIRQTPQWNISLKSTYMSTNYQQIGTQISLTTPAGATQTNQISFGYGTERLGSMGISYTVIKLFAAPNAVSNPGPQLSKLGTVSYNLGLFANTNLTLSAIKDFHNANNNQVYAAINMTIDKDRNLNTFVNYQNKQTQPGVLYSRNLPLGDGYGYHLLATTKGQNGPGGDFTYQNEVGTYTAKAYHIINQNYYEADMSGAAVYFDKYFFLSRRMTQSFALAQVPGYENVRVYYQNQVIGKTDRDGNLLIPNLLPYQNDTLTLEPRDLPLATNIVKGETQVMPYFRSGSLAKFDVARSKNILVKLIQANGDFVPAGATAWINNHSYPVGYAGIAFLPRPDIDTMRGSAKWGNTQCYFDLLKQNTYSAIRASHVLCAV